MIACDNTVLSKRPVARVRVRVLMRVAVGAGKPCAHAMMQVQCARALH